MAADSGKTTHNTEQNVNKNRSGLHASNAHNREQVILHENHFEGGCAHNVRNTRHIHTVTQKRPHRTIPIPISDAWQVEQRLRHDLRHTTDACFSFGSMSQNTEQTSDNYYYNTSDKQTTGAWIHRVLNRFDRLGAILQCPAALSILEGVTLDLSPDPAKTNSFCNHSQVVNAKNIRLQHMYSVPDDDEGGVSNALSHSNSKSSAADMSLRCLELSNLLCNRIKSLLDGNKLSTLLSRAATRARSVLDALQTFPGLTAYVRILGKAEPNFCACSQSINHHFPP